LKFAGPALKFGQGAWARLSDGDRLKLEQTHFAEKTIDAVVLKVNKAAEYAHGAVIGSANDPLAQDQHQSAVVHGCSACRDITGHFSDGGDPPRLPGNLRSAIQAYREAVSNDDNLSAGSADEKEARVKALDDGVNFLVTELRRCAYLKLGVGSGSWSGRKKGRGDPTKT
jgi:hypothetical protein